MARRQHQTKISGFSLVELAVVLVILGLLVGGILGGQSLRRGQELRSIGIDAGNFMIAMNQFKKKYDYVAGDFPTATNVWGTVGGGNAQCTDPDTTDSVGATTCNGDGNGFLTPGGHEPHRAWQHLVAAGLLQGTYRGTAPYEFGVSAPASRIESSGFGWVGGLIQFDAVTTSAAYFDGDYTNMLSFGSLPTVIAGVDSPALTPAQAFELDTKFDDGLPSTGSLRGFESATTCASSATSYNLIATTNTCALLFLSTFKTK